MKYRMYAQRIFCFNWRECIEFYQHTIQLPLKYSDPVMGWAEFDLAGVSLAIERLERDDPEAEALVGRLVGISLQVDDIEATYQQLSSVGVPFIAPPEHQEWGGTLAHFSDPDGNVVTLLGAE